MALTSEQRAEVNRANARKSTGPKSAGGKARSAANALKHGLTAQASHVIPGEDPDAHAAFVQTWLDGYNPATPGRLALVERAAEAAWKLRRLAQFEEAHAAHRARHAADDFAQQQVARAERLGDLLRFDPLGDHARSFVNDLQRLERNRTLRERADPMIVTRELDTFLAGVDWKIDRWTDLKTLLEQDGFWDYDAKFLAVRLFGYRPEEVIIEPGTRYIFMCCNVLHPENKRFYDDALQGITGSEGRSSNIYLSLNLEDHKPSAADALSALRDIVAQELNRLRNLRDRLAPIHDADCAEAETRALFDSTPESARLQRYELALDRSLRQTIQTLESEPERAVETPPVALAQPVSPADPAPSVAAEPPPTAAQSQARRTSSLRPASRRNEASSGGVVRASAEVSGPNSMPCPPLPGAIPPRSGVA